MPTDGASILIVEEEPTLADITAFRLELLGYTVASVRSAAEALDGMQEKLPDAILLGMSLSGTDAIDLAHRLSNDERTHGVPIMALSADADLTKVQRAFAAGAKDFLVTPFDPLVLEQKLERLLTSSSAG